MLEGIDLGMMAPMKRGGKNHGTTKGNSAPKTLAGLVERHAAPPAHGGDAAITARAAAPKEEKSIDRAVAAIRRLRHASSINFAIGVGRIVVEHIFGGDIKEVRRKGPKAKTLQELANRPDLPISARDLSVAVGIYELLDRVNVLGEVPTWELLGYSHVRALLPAPPKEQERLFEAASEHKWTVRVLSAEVAKVVTEPKGGRRRASGVVKAVAALAKNIDGLTKAVATQGSLPARERKSVKDTLARASDAIAKLQQALK